MKKLVAMVLALCLLMACVPAFATLTLPETVADVPGAVEPVMPDYTLTEVDDHYELVIDGVNASDVHASIYGYDEDGRSCGSQSFWVDGDVLVIDDLLSGDDIASRHLDLYMYTFDGSVSTSSNYRENLESQELLAFTNSIEEDGCITEYRWYKEDNIFSYTYTTPEKDVVSVEYSLLNGDVRSYDISYSDGPWVSYNRYGRITGGELYIEDDGSYYWSNALQQWINMETGEVNTEIPGLTSAEYPAPYAVPYNLYKPSADLENLDTSYGYMYEYEDGTSEYWDSAMSVMYDADGKLQLYTYWNYEGTKNVTYSADDVLLFASVNVGNGCSYVYDAEAGGWFYDNGDELIEIDESDLPEDVTVDDMEPLKDPVPVASKVQYTWYDHNTVGLVGLSLRDMGITDKWYNVVPVDLTQDGVQVLDLVGSNLFHIGKAAVIVQDGKVSVDYDLFFGEGYVKDECVQWFTSLDDITTDFLNNPTSDVAFGQELSIADDLGGAETAILFICNRVTYRQPYNGDNGYLSRYWPNRQRWIDYRAELTELLEGMSK